MIYSVSLRSKTWRPINKHNFRRNRPSINLTNQRKWSRRNEVPGGHGPKSQHGRVLWPVEFFALWLSSTQASTPPWLVLFLWPNSARASASSWPAPPGQSFPFCRPQPNPTHSLWSVSSCPILLGQPHLVGLFVPPFA